LNIIDAKEVLGPSGGFKFPHKYSGVNTCIAYQ